MPKKSPVRGILTGLKGDGNEGKEGNFIPLRLVLNSKYCAIFRLILRYFIISDNYSYFFVLVSRPIFSSRQGNALESVILLTTGT